MTSTSHFSLARSGALLAGICLVLTVWAQEAGIPYLTGGFFTAGGSMSAGSVEITGLLGSPFTTGSMENAGGVRVETGVFAVSSEAEALAGDLDGDSDVDFGDFLKFASAFGARTTDPHYNRKADLDSNGFVDFGDFLAFAGAFGA